MLPKAAVFLERAERFFCGFCASQLTSQQVLKKVLPFAHVVLRRRNRGIPPTPEGKGRAAGAMVASCLSHPTEGVQQEVS